MKRLWVPVVAVIIVLFASALFISRLVTDRSELTQRLAAANMALDAAGDNTDFMRTDFQRALLSNRSSDFESSAPAGLHLGRLLSGDHRAVKVDWVEYDGEAVTDRYRFTETLPVDLMVTIYAQGKTNVIVNDVDTAPRIVNVENWDAVLKRSAGGEISHSYWWFVIDGDSRVMQMIQAPGLK